MSNTVIRWLSISFTGATLVACSPRHISTKYYDENKLVLDSMEVSYKKLYKDQPFNLAFTDRYFQSLSLEIITDTLTYVYEFKLNEPRLNDTLLKYGCNVSGTTSLIRQMRSIRSTWINQYDYYVGVNKRSLIFVSIKPVALRAPFSKLSYYIIAYFSQPQFFDNEGRLLDRRRQKRLRKINGETLMRINDKVCYTVSGRFR